MISADCAISAALVGFAMMVRSARRIEALPARVRICRIDAAMGTCTARGGLTCLKGLELAVAGKAPRALLQAIARRGSRIYSDSKEQYKGGQADE